MDLLKVDREDFYHNSNNLFNKLEDVTKKPMQCPICNGRLVLKTNKFTGEQFYGCFNYPKCNFTTNFIGD